jgi:hypothetical protein
MGRTPYLAYLWPGLPTILANGSWFGLAWAAGFAVLINLLMLASLWWPELFLSHIRSGLWLATAVFWCGATIASLRALRDADPEEAAAAVVTFGDATKLYLRADWFGLERILGDLLHKNPRDVEAGLMLATSWRHTGRIREASQQLDRLELLDGARRWMLEIHQERKHLAVASASAENAIEMSRAA